LPEAIHGWWPKDGTPSNEFNEAVSKQLENPKNVYIFFAPGEGFDRYPHVERLAKSLGKTLSLENVFYERDGSIAYRLYKASSPNAVPCIASVPSKDWKGEYYDNISLSASPVMVRNDGNSFLNFDWKSDSPASFCGLAADNFSVRWTRTVKFNAGTYNFTVTSDDGFRLYIDGQLKLDKWFDQGSTSYIVNVPLTSGKHTIKMEYYERSGEAVAKFIWKSSKTKR
jgi:hypothetical protein